MRATTLLAFSLLAGACSSEDTTPAQSTAPCADPVPRAAPLGTRCGMLVDAQGRVTVLRGVNARVDGIFDVTFDDGRTALEPIPAFDESDASALRDFGFDALRLPINWSGIEPTESGGFDEAYLDRVAHIADICEAAGIFVLLDFHQDAYSKEIGEDGAPLWAILPPPTQLLEGPLTDLGARRLSQQVSAAFTTFFGDSSDGGRLRDRFSAMAAHVAERFAAHPAVIGFEIFNEPETDDAGITRLNDAAYAIFRSAAPRKVYLFEPPVIRNLTDSSSLADAPLGPMTAYAPHVYTLAFIATDAQKQAMTKDLLRTSNENARSEADSWAAPLVITEWGYDPNGIRSNDYFIWQSELQEEYQASSFFWLWKEQSQGNWGCYDYDATSNTFSVRTGLQEALARVRPAKIAGWPLSYGFDKTSGVFELHFRADPTISAPHVIAVAPALGPPLEVSCDGAPVEHRDAAIGATEVDCGRGTASEHTLRVVVANSG